MITTKEKDAILTILIQNDGGTTLDGKKIATDLNISASDVMKVVDHLDRRGFLEFLGMAQYYFAVHFTLEGDDFYKRGGFEYEEMLASMELNKLMWELESLETLIPKEKYNRLMTGLGVIISALALTKQ